MQPIRKKKKSVFAQTAWKVFVILVGLTMVLGMVLPFVSLTAGK